MSTYDLGDDFLVPTEGLASTTMADYAGGTPVYTNPAGQVDTWESLGGWNVMELANSVGLYLTDGSLIQIHRRLCHLPPVDTSTGWLSTNHYFGWDAKIQKFNFLAETFSGDGGAGNTNEAPNSPGYINSYEEWESWWRAPDGYAAKNAVGYYQYIDFYDWLDRSYGGPPGVEVYTDYNQLQRFNIIRPVRHGDTLYVQGAPYWNSHPYVDYIYTEELNQMLSDMYSSDDSFRHYTNPSFEYKDDIGTYGGIRPGGGLLLSDLIGLTGEYDRDTMWITAFYYGYSKLRTAIMQRYRTLYTTTEKYENYVNDLVLSLSSQKLSSSEKFYTQKQKSKKFTKNNLSAVTRGFSTLTETETATGETIMESFTYDTETGGGTGGADDYSY